MSKAQVKRNGRQPRVRSPWPFVAMAAGAVLIIAAAFLVWRGGNSIQTSSPSGNTGRAQLSVDRDRVDLGRVPFNQSVRATFTLKNVGDQPLRILGEPRVELIQGC